MTYFQHAPVDAYIVHKDHLDDVLVSNFRSELPTRLTEHSLRAEWLTPEDCELLLTHYSVPSEIDALGLSQDGMLFRRSVPATLQKSVADEPGFGFVCEYYRETPAALVLNSLYIREEHEVALMSRYVTPDRQISAHERHRLAQITDRMNCNERSSRYYMNMMNDLSHYFFYRKHHEHVPGIMLIEVARQAIYAQYYRTSPHKRGEVTLTIQRMECEFGGYVESNYPVVVSAETLVIDDDPAPDRNVYRKTRFFQNGKLVATINMNGTLIKMKTFKRLRVVKPDPNHWFVPVKAFAKSALFFDESGNRIEGKLRKVSLDGMEVQLDRNFSTEAALDFVLSVDGIGYVDGKVRVADVYKDGKTTSSRLSISELSTDAERRWLEAIKNFSHLECVAEPHL